MPLIQNPGPGRKLQRAMRLTELPDSILAPEIVGTILLEDLSAPLTDTSRGCMGMAQAGAVLAENAIIVLVRVGAPARYDLQVTDLLFVSGIVQEIRVIVPTAGVFGLTASGATSFTDFELPGRPSSQLGLDTQVGFPAGRILMRFTVEPDVFYRIPVKIRIGTIGIGDELTSIMIGAVTTNTVLRAGFIWTESSPLG